MIVANLFLHANATIISAALAVSQAWIIYRKLGLSKHLDLQHVPDWDEYYAF